MNATIRQILSPRHATVETVVVQNGQSVLVGQPILKLDSLNFEREQQKAQVHLRLLDIAAERLTDDYLNAFVYGPMQSMITFRSTVVSDRQAMRDDVAGRIGVPQPTIDGAEAKLDEAKAELSNAVDSLARKKLEIAKQKLDKEAERTQLTQSVQFMQRLIDLSTIVAPVAGKIDLGTVAGVFVERGDLLFEISL